MSKKLFNIIVAATCIALLSSCAPRYKTPPELRGINVTSLDSNIKIIKIQ